MPLLTFPICCSIFFFTFVVSWRLFLEPWKLQWHFAKTHGSKFISFRISVILPCVCWNLSQETSTFSPYYLVLVCLFNKFLLSFLSTTDTTSKGKDKSLPSFWVPSLTPQAEPTLLKKPDTKTYCPMSGKPLKIKDLVTVKLTPIDDKDDGRPMVAKSERYKCAVTHDALGNSVPCAVLKNTGHVVTMDCVEKLIKKDMLCPFTGAKLKDSDIIPLQRGGTGFAGAGVQLEAKKAGPVLQA